MRSEAVSGGAFSTARDTVTRLPVVVAKFMLIEYLVVASTAFLASVIYHRFILLIHFNAHDYFFAAILFAALVSLVSAAFRNFSDLPRQPRHVFLWSGIGVVWLAFSIFLATLFLFKIANEYSRGVLLFQVFGVSVAVTATRGILYSWLHAAIASGLLEARRVILIGDAAQCAQFSERLKTNGIHTIACLRWPSGFRRSNGSTSGEIGFRISSKIRKVLDTCRLLRPDDIIILSDQESLPRSIDLTSCLSELPFGLHIVPADALNILSASQIRQFGNFQTIELYRPPLTVFDRAIKRTFDIIVASISLLLISPLFLIVALAIKMESPGPVFFRQSRHGFNNELIRVFKFRTMKAVDEPETFTQATKNDARVTRVGRILRQTNIDEIPQLLNVLLGDMSIVGPRPHATTHNELFRDKIAPFSRRHSVKPGITGWAQINGLRGVTDTLEKMQRRVEYDLYYIDNWSLMLDVKILLMTVFSKKAYVNAY